MLDASPGAHHLNIARFGSARIAKTVPVADCPATHIGNDLHVLMAVRRKTALRGDRIVIPDPQGTPLGSGRIVIIGEGKMVVGIEPAVVGGADTGKGIIGSILEQPWGLLTYKR